jgi:hypothetical protein
MRSNRSRTRMLTVLCCCSHLCALCLLLSLLLLQELEAIGAGPELDRLIEEQEVKSTAPSRR